MSYYRPTELKDALAILAEKNPVVLAGGTDLFPATDRPMLQGEVLDITGISALSGIGEVDGYTRIGAATKWSEIIAADLPPAFDALKLSAREVGSVQIQNSGTIGGNLCNASPAADGVPPLLILDAEVEITSKSGRRTLPLDTFIKGNRRTDIADGEVLSAILLPNGALKGQSNFLKLGARKYLVISIAMVAVRVTVSGRKIETASISVGSCSEVARRLTDLESALVGQEVNDLSVSRDLVRSALSPIDDIRADSDYRLNAASELVRRTFFGALS